MPAGEFSRGSTMISHEGQSGPKALRSLLDHEPIVRCLGAHDVLTAKLIEQAGLECLFVGGFGVSASLLGLPDMNLVHLPMMADAAKRTINAVSIPVIIDGDTGHGDLHNVQQTVELFEQVGAAGILIEIRRSPNVAAISTASGSFPWKRWSSRFTPPLTLAAIRISC
jgi:2-methylisocitrate lyase-like PEP mutase family enzyme